MTESARPIHIQLGVHVNEMIIGALERLTDSGIITERVIYTSGLQVLPDPAAPVDPAMGTGWVPWIALYLEIAGNDTGKIYSTPVLRSYGTTQEVIDDVVEAAYVSMVAARSGTVGVMQPDAAVGAGG